MTHTVLNTPCPTRRVQVTLALGTIEELEQLAGREHISRDQLLGQIIRAGLASDTPHLPSGEDPVRQLAERAYATHHRSLELAGLA